MKKTDLIIIALILLAALALTVFFLLRPESFTVEVRTEGELTAVLSLLKDESVNIEGSAGGLTVAVQNRKVFVSGAGCPDRICERMPPLGSGGGSIICVPNRCIITVSEGRGNDALTG